MDEAHKTCPYSKALRGDTMAAAAWVSFAAMLNFTIWRMNPW
jgi:hypothetical protein